MKRIRKTAAEQADGNPLIRGTIGFCEIFKIKDSRTIAKLRSKGMPAIIVGREYYYDPIEVKAWLKANQRVQIPAINY